MRQPRKKMTWRYLFFVIKNKPAGVSTVMSRTANGRAGAVSTGHNHAPNVHWLNANGGTTLEVSVPKYIIFPNGKSSDVWSEATNQKILQSKNKLDFVHK